MSVACVSFCIGAQHPVPKWHCTTIRLPCLLRLVHQGVQVVDGVVAGGAALVQQGIDGAAEDVVPVLADHQPIAERSRCVLQHRRVAGGPGGPESLPAWQRMEYFESTAALCVEAALFPLQQHSRARMLLAIVSSPRALRALAHAVSLRHRPNYRPQLRFNVSHPHLARCDL